MTTRFKEIILNIKLRMPERDNLSYYEEDENELHQNDTHEEIEEKTEEEKDEEYRQKILNLYYKMKLFCKDKKLLENLNPAILSRFINENLNTETLS